MIGRLALAAFAALLGSTLLAQAPRRPPSPPPAPPPPSDIRVRSHLTQTAAWVGDPVSFVIEIDAGPGVEIVASDLAIDKLTIDGLEPGATTSEVLERAEGWRTLRSVYRVTPWDTIPPKRIGPLTVRYRRAITTASADGSTAADEIVVPGVSLAMRSTLPDDGSAHGTRAGVAAVPAPTWLTWLRPLGLGLVILGIAPVGLWLVSRVRRPTLTRPRVSSRSLKAEAAAMFGELAIIDTSTTEGRLRAYDRLESGLRAYVARAATLPAAALTPDELRQRLADSKRVPAATVCDALEECERARYAPAERVPDASALAATIDRLAAALGHARA